MKLAILCLILISNVFAAKIEVTLSPQEVVLGDTLNLTISVTHDEQTNPFITFIPKNAEVIGKSESESMRAYLQGGKLVKEKVFSRTYELQPVGQGYVYIRDIQADLGNQTLKHRSIRAKVLKEAKKVRDYFLKAEVDKKQIYVGEGININYYLYYPSRISGLTVKKFPKLKDFIKRFEMPRTHPETVNIQGRVFRKQLIYRARSFPVKAGKLKVDQLIVEFQYPDMRSTRRDMFGMALGFSTGRYKRKTLRSSALDIEALPLPAQGMPSNFSGLVGEHKFSFNMPKTKALVNEALEARLEVIGEGALERFDPVPLFNQDHFESFEPKTEISELSVLETKKTIDYTYLANKAGKIPARQLEISYFDPITRSYKVHKIDIPEVSIYGSGAKSETITSDSEQERSSVEPQREDSSRDPRDISFVGPLYEYKDGFIFNLEYQNLILFILLLVIVFSGQVSSLSGIFKRQARFTKTDLTYRGIHRFITEHFEGGETVRERINSSNMPKATKAYFVDILSKAEKNEYKSSKIKLKYDKKHVKNALRSINENNKFTSRS